MITVFTETTESALSKACNNGIEVRIPFTKYFQTESGEYKIATESGEFEVAFFGGSDDPKTAEEAVNYFSAMGFGPNFGAFVNLKILARSEGGFAMIDGGTSVTAYRIAYPEYRNGTIVISGHSSSHTKWPKTEFVAFRRVSK